MCDFSYFSSRKSTDKRFLQIPIHKKKFKKSIRFFKMAEGEGFPSAMLRTGFSSLQLYLKI